MALAIAPAPVPLRLDESGTVRVGMTRVTLGTVVHAFRGGDTPEAIADAFPTLALAEAYAVIAYYLAHREEVDAYLKDEEQAAAAVRDQIVSRPDYQEWRERILARREAKGR